MKIIAIVAVFILLISGAVFAAENTAISANTLTQKDKDCIAKYECKEKNGSFWFGCYYEQADDSCHCFLGEFSQCNQNLTIQSQGWCQRMAGSYCDSAKDLASSIWSDRRFVYGAAAAVVLIIFLIWLYNRDVPKNNLRRARNFHKKAEKEYVKGNDEKAQEYYDIANHYREKANR